MTESKKRYLQVPQGTEGVHLEEAYRHRHITQQLFNLFHLWGYLPVETPVFDFYDIYEPLLHGSTKSVYRLIDREGDLLMLRSDITLFLAKQMGLWLREDDLPTRVCYADTILRHQHAEDISRNEFFQVGAELMGKAGSEADLEILLLLEKTFLTLGITPAIHLGSHKFMTTVLKDFNERELTRAMQFIINRDTEQLRGLMRPRFSGKRLEVILSLFSFIGTWEEFQAELERHRKELSPEEHEDLTYIIYLARQMQALGYARELCIDLSEVGAQPYYTGIVFQVYLPDLDDAVASGGRYDKLLNVFGFDCPSVGFSLMQRKIEDLIDAGFGKPDTVTRAEGADFIESFRAAQKLRDEGVVTIL